MTRVSSAVGSLVLVVALGCSGVISTPVHVVERDVSEHLTTRYGEPFVITRVSNESSAAVGIVDRFRFEAHPEADASIVVRGDADYGGERPAVSDNYACEKVRRWLPGHLAARLERPVRLKSVSVYCNDELPPDPAPGARLPPGQVTVHIKAQTFAEGDPVEALTAARGALVAVTNSLGVELKGELWSHPPVLWSHFEQRPEPPKSPRPDDGSQMVYAFERLSSPGTVTRYARDGAVEAMVTALISERHPGARVAVWARVPAAGGGRTVVDARIAADGLALNAVRDTALVLAEQVPHDWTLRAMDRPSAAEPARASVVCHRVEPRSRTCEDSDQTWIDPDWAGDGAAGG